MISSSYFQLGMSLSYFCVKKLPAQSESVIVMFQTFGSNRKVSIFPAGSIRENVKGDATASSEPRLFVQATGPSRLNRQPADITRVGLAQTFASSSSAFARGYNLSRGLYHLTACLFIAGLVCSQLLGAVWDYTSTTQHIVFGRNPLLGPYQIVGTNDVPYADRVIACVGNGRSYRPHLVSSLLAAPGVTAILEDSSGTAVHGYRLKQRRVGSITDSLDSNIEADYSASCALVAQTLENILNACESLGYSNLTNDNLRVADDWDSANLFLPPDTLPVLIMPYTDNTLRARHAIPTWRGDACIFHLEDGYVEVDATDTMLSFRGVNRSAHHERTIELLRRPGGTWKKGWYEDLEGMRWYSDVTNSNQKASYSAMLRLFDMRSGREIDCSNPSKCDVIPHMEWWGSKFSASFRPHRSTSVYIANGTEFGLFTYETHMEFVVRSVFDWETLLSNVSVGLVLARWLLALISMLVEAHHNKTRWYGGGIGCVSGAESFAYLPLASLPRLKMTLTAFWSVGCLFEGQQLGLAEAWFAVYPAIVHFVLVYYSLLDLLAKALRRRVSDALFTPTIVVLCLLHYFRIDLAASGWLSGVDGRMQTLVFSDEVKSLRLADYFTTDVAWRMNGRVPELFAAKLCILGFNLLPLLFAQSFPVESPQVGRNLQGVELALGIRVRDAGGLGRSLGYTVAVIDTRKRRLTSSVLVARRDSKPNVPSFKHVVSREPIAEAGVLSCVGAPLKRAISIAKDSREIVLVNSYELTRLGYLVFGERYFTTFDEWAILAAMRLFRTMWNRRILVWTLDAADGDAKLTNGRALLSTQPQIRRLDDPHLQQISWWHISSCSIQC